MANIILNNKKKALLTRKEKLLEEIQYYEKRITDFHANRSKDSYIDHDSSDSDTDIPLVIDNTPSVSQLKLQLTTLQTSLQATQELTSLQVLQSEINVLSEPPTLEYGPPVQEEGLWHQVALECRVDLVAFAITFLMHKAARKFGPRSYRDIRVIPVKAAHESELSRSVLTMVTTPSDALEVVKSYASAHRSRRTSLARLAEKYAGVLFMEPMPDGGYVLKCADLLEMSWTLDNKWSPIAAFQHCMKFELEYMDESYIKVITQLHRQLSDPSLKTDERTLLLSKIISTCLEAKVPTQELYESMESDPETAQKLRKRRTTLNQEEDVPTMKKKKDNEVMAPPKSLPKKTKPKGKENNDLNRPSTSKEGLAKKMKLSEVSKSLNERSEIDGRNEKKSTKIDKASERVKGNKKTMTEITNTQNVDTLNEKNDTEKLKNNVETKNKPSNENKNHKLSKKPIVQKNVETTNKNDGNAFQAGGSKSANNVDEKKNLKSKKDTVPNVDATKKDDGNALLVHTSKSTNNKVEELTNSKSSKKSNVQNVASSKNNDENNLQARTSKSSYNNVEEQITKLSKKSNVQKNVVSSKNNNEEASQARASKSDGNNVNDLNIKKIANKKNSAQKNVGSAKKNDDDSSQPPSKTMNKNVDELKNPKIAKKSDVPKNIAPTKRSDDVTQSQVTTSTNNNVKNKITQINEDTDINSDTNVVKSSEKLKKDSNKLKVDNKKSTDADKDKNIITKNKITEKNYKNKVQSTGTISKTTSQDDIQKVVEKNKKVASNLAEIPNAKNKASNNPVNKPKIVKVNQENNKKAGNVQNKAKIIANKNQPKSQLDRNEKVSKIPQKKTSVSGSVLKNPLRISPRKLPLKMKTSIDSIKKTMQKPLTSIPRLLKKQMPKI